MDVKLVRGKTGEGMRIKNVQTTVKYNGRIIMIARGMAASGLGNLDIIYGVLNQYDYPKILRMNLKNVHRFRSFWKFLLNARQLSKHKAKTGKEWLYNAQHSLYTPPHYTKFARH